MNTIYKYKSRRFDDDTETLPFADFFVNHPVDVNKKQAKKVEKFVEEFSIDLLRYNIDSNDETSDEFILLRHDYEEMIASIRQCSLSQNQLGLISWLINRAFIVTPNIQAKQQFIQSKLSKNKSLLLKTLYDVNKKAFFRCFLGPTN